MRTSRLYVDSKLKEGDILDLPEQSGHYLANVLRLEEGDTIQVFNSVDGEFTASIEQVSRKQLRVRVNSQSRFADPAKLSTHLGVGLSRGDRMDYLIQKATELGVMRISPLFTEFGEVRFKQEKRLDNKLRHWRQVAVSACEQSGRVSVPEIAAPRVLADWFADVGESTRVILQPGGESRLTELTPEAGICVLSGPEGGFSDTELELADQSGFKAVAMGPRILRTETAPVAALAILQSCYGDI